MRACMGVKDPSELWFNRDDDGTKPPTLSTKEDKKVEETEENKNEKKIGENESEIEIEQIQEKDQEIEK